MDVSLAAATNLKNLVVELWTQNENDKENQA